MRAAYDRVIIPMLEEFAPELVLISAGFDAAVADPLANLNWTTEDFAWVTRRICDVAEPRIRPRAWSRHSKAAMIWMRWPTGLRRMCRF